VKGKVDWIRATFSGAILGGFFWAIMAKVMSVITHGKIPAGFLYTFSSLVSVGVLAIGVVLYLTSTGSYWRSTAIGIILAPLTGWSLLLFVTLTFVLPSWIH
jgi:hypothetical protein